MRSEIFTRRAARVVDPPERRPEWLHPHRDRGEAIRHALSDVDRLETTIEDLLHLARDTAGQRAPVNLAQALHDLERRWQGGFVADGRRLVVDTTQRMASPTVSGAALAHVLDVLVDNARRHGAGEVLVGAREMAGAIAVSVTDRGTGIVDPAAIFERRHSGAGGTGIGLALARRLTEAEGGRGRLRETAEGTSFELTLPVTRPEGGRLGTLHSASPPPVAAQAPTPS